jgi:PPM family protein phosphatase
MTIDRSLLLQNIHAALANQQYQQATFLLEYVMTLTEDAVSPPASSPFDVSIGLHRGQVRDVNEDCLLAMNGVLPEAHRFGLYVVCDGMGGHASGQEAAHLAIQTIVDVLLPQLLENTPSSPWEHLIVESIQQANRAISLRNQFMDQQSGVSVNTSHISHMGTTITAALLLDAVAYVANVGDSRTYLYDQALSKITKDHSLVAQLFEGGYLQEEEIYVHPQRNQITRALGIEDAVQVDTFCVPLQGHEILLLCSDGLWEMTRDREIEKILASPWANASSMRDQLVQLANDGGGKDNIGCIVIQQHTRTDIGAMATIMLDPAGVLSKEAGSAFFLA